MAISHAVWAACRACDTKAPSPQRLKDATNTIISSFDNALQALTRTPKVHPRKRDDEHREFLSLLRSLDRSATQYFTDGSSFGNPGPAGAGIAAFRNDTCIFSRCVSLGIASNNVVELEGLSAACDHALLTMADPTQGRATKIFFCDNRYALSMAEGKWRAAIWSTMLPTNLRPSNRGPLFSCSGCRAMPTSARTSSLTGWPSPAPLAAP